MSLIRNLAGFLATNDIGTIWNGSTGDIFVEDMPADPANCLMLLSNISPEPDQYLDTQTLNFDIWCRNVSAKTAADKLNACFTLLHRYHHVQLGGYYVYFIGAVGNIENLGKDSERRSLQKITFRAIYKDSSTVS